ncbi:cytochrome c oxidase subunit II [bacterium]|nr:MAG: cytochrome c oxidase subunit II [bacterium]
MSDWKKAVPLISLASAALALALFNALEWVHLMPGVQAAKEAAIVDSAFGNVIFITVIIFSVVVAAILYMVVFFRAGPGQEEGARFDASPGKMVEVVWLAASCVLTFGLAAYGSEEFLHLRHDSRADLDVQVKAAQWSWEFFYPSQNVNAAELILPLGKRARISITSEDVVHSFWVPAFRLKQDALPGRVTTLYVTPTVKGEYDVVCAELCGLDHSVMRGKVLVVDPEEFEGKLKGEAW